jgi:hypothetical protein
MASVTPVWADNVSVVASTNLARGSTVRGTIDLSAKFGAWLFVRIARGGTAALTNGIDVLIRRLFNSVVHPGSLVPLNSGFTAASATTVNADSASGQQALNVASITGFAAGDIICINQGGAREEWARVSKTAAGVLTLDDDLQFTHTAAQADTVRNQAFTPPPIWLPGGAVYEVIFDYGDDSAGDTAQVMAVAQRYDSDTIA